jgi:hypothetical protein
MTTKCLTALLFITLMTSPFIACQLMWRDSTTNPTTKPIATTQGKWSTFTVAKGDLVTMMQYAPSGATYQFTDTWHGHLSSVTQCEKGRATILATFAGFDKPFRALSIFFYDDGPPREWQVWDHWGKKFDGKCQGGRAITDQGERVGEWIRAEVEAMCDLDAVTVHNMHGTCGSTRPTDAVFVENGPILLPKE